MFRGQLYAGKLFFGQLFGPEEEVTPQTEIPLTYYGSGGKRHEAEADLVAQVLDKWRVIEKSRADREAKRLEKRQALKRLKVEQDQAVAVESIEIVEAPAADVVPESGSIVPKSGAIEAVPAGKPALPVIQTLFTPAPERVAPTRSTPATVFAPLDDGMEDVMTLLLALEEAGEL